MICYILGDVISLLRDSKDKLTISIQCSLKEGLACTINAELELIAMLTWRARAIRTTLGTNRGFYRGRYTVDTELEFITVLASRARAITTASSTYLLSRCSWNAPVELIAVMIGSTI